jgi:hypothetical protein
MKLFYYCFGGAHTSVTCASIHLGFLPDNRIPRPDEFLAVPYYDKMDNDKLGTPVYVGRDEFGWDIYVMGIKRGNRVVIPAIKSYLYASGINDRNVLFVNALVKLHPITSFGGFSSRKLHMVNFGRPLTIWGIRRSYPIFVDLVRRVKENLSRQLDFS